MHSTALDAVEFMCRVRQRAAVDDAPYPIALCICDAVVQDRSLELAKRRPRPRPNRGFARLTSVRLIHKRQGLELDLSPT